MNHLSRLEGLYLANLVLLALHESDSASWREWELFGLPGGIQFFVALHVGLFLPLFYGLVRLVRTPRSGALYGIARAEEPLS